MFSTPVKEFHINNLNIRQDIHVQKIKLKKIGFKDRDL